YNIGDSIPFTVTYEYKGRAQRGQLIISLGTGSYPAFLPVVNYDPMAVSFEEAMDWTRMSISGTFRLTPSPPLRQGQLYNTRARLETLEDPAQETDTDWGIIRIAEVAPPPPPPAPPPEPPPVTTYTLTTTVLPSVAYGWIKRDPNKTVYDYNERVEITAIVDPHVATTHVFSHWDIDGVTYDVGPRVNLIMDRDHKATAFFMRRL
ncbi:unnamed protein product, partial [marine sediment metagenome]